MRYESIHMRVDADLLSGDDAFAVIEPIWWTVDIYQGPKRYADTLAAFTPYQRQLFATVWYDAEVLNGGHDQFYFNSTGIVWQDALAGFELLELTEFTDLLRESAQRLGGTPSLEREVRWEAMERLTPQFDDLDARFYHLESVVDLNDQLLCFIRTHPNDFAFDGIVRRPVI
jgi:hypothetical protein